LAPILAGFSHCARGFYDARNISTAGPRPGKGTAPGALNLLSQHTDRWTLYLLQRGRAERRANAFAVARASFLIPDVRALFSRLSDRYHLVAPDYPGFGHSDWPDSRKFSYTFDHIAGTMNHFTEAIGLSRYTLYMQDYGGPVGFRMALAHPDRIEALIVQNAVAHNEGLGRHVGSDPNVERYAPDLWTDEFAFLSQPGQVDIQSDLFYDYRTNVDSYPKWQEWMSERQPRLLVIWGKYDPSFDVSEPEAYRRDVPNAEIHVLDAGHFALDTKADEIAAFMGQFMRRQK
jgi:pimeloyl-ACP methyl ester carboxylesterase